MGDAFKKVAGVSLAGYGVANLAFNFNTLVKLGSLASPFAMGTLVAAGVGVLALWGGAKLLTSKTASPA